MKNITAIVRSCMLCFLLVGLGGCALLDPGPPMTQVVLPVHMPIEKISNRMPVQVLVTQPVTDGATGTDRILALMDGYKVRALSEAKWVSPVPWLVQRLLIDSLEASRRFEGVGWEESALDANIRLSTDIRRFFLLYETSSKPPVVDLVFIFTLSDLKTGKTFARNIITVRQPCAGNTLHEFVAAYSIGMGKVLAQGNEWLIGEIENRVKNADTVMGK